MRNTGTAAHLGTRDLNEKSLHSKKTTRKTELTHFATHKKSCEVKNI